MSRFADHEAPDDQGYANAALAVLACYGTWELASEAGLGLAAILAIEVVVIALCLLPWPYWRSTYRRVSRALERARTRTGNSAALIDSWGHTRGASYSA
ncbi:MAG: hypothetical protein OXG82_04370 [Gammaproteobacteria bacterium]|nr:hypothetical protein [Gammaproteobacteria bacterium]